MDKIVSIAKVDKIKGKLCGEKSQVEVLKWRVSWTFRNNCFHMLYLKQ
jgi:hypothetical protein